MTPGRWDHKEGSRRHGTIHPQARCDHEEAHREEAANLRPWRRRPIIHGCTPAVWAEEHGEEPHCCAAAKEHLHLLRQRPEVALQRLIYS
jgi:hypothetical protein